MSHEYVLDTIEFDHGITAKVVADPEPTSPEEWDNVGKIAYTSDRYTLGTEHVSRERMDEIAEGIRSGRLIGLPVYAYVHGGATIRAGQPYGDPWDSGQSGFVYCTREKALAEFGKKIVTKKVIERAHKCLKAEVQAYDQYLTGDVWGVVVEDANGDQLDSCWGFYGSDYAREQAQEMGKAAVAAAAREKSEVRAWAERDVRTAP